MKIWQKYLFRKLFFTFFFITIALFSIYTTIDLSIHGVRFLTLGPEATLLDLFLYYLRQFAMHLDLFLPLSFLLSLYKVLFALNTHLELIALQMAGLSKKKLLLPFFFFATILSTICYLNHEYFAGEATAAAAAFKSSHTKKIKIARTLHLQTLLFDDQSELIFQSFDPEKKEFFDAYWISDKDLWHMKTLSIAKQPPTAYFADHLVRENKLLVKQESFVEKEFPTLPLDETTTPKVFIPFESRPLSTLFLESSVPSIEAPSVKTHLHYKLALPLFPLLILLSASPFALSFSRHKRVFLIISLSLFAFLVYLTLFDSLLILGENSVLPPLLAMWFCPTIVTLFSLRRFAKI